MIDVTTITDEDEINQLRLQLERRSEELARAKEEEARQRHLAACEAAAATIGEIVAEGVDIGEAVKLALERMAPEQREELSFKLYREAKAVKSPGRAPKELIRGAPYWRHPRKHWVVWTPINRRGKRPSWLTYDDNGHPTTTPDFIHGAP
jgi:hypothetical protein